MNPIKQFEQEREDRISDNGKDKKLTKLANEWLSESMMKQYVYNFSWLGRPIIQTPSDIMAMQEIVWDVKPDMIIETGIAHGGSLLLSASLLTLLEECGEIEKGYVLGIDIDIRTHNKKAIEEHPMSKKITMFEGSSIDDSMIAKVHEFAKKGKKILVCLDSNHTHEHVMAELKAYSQLASVGSYCIVFDTLVEDMPSEFSNDRPWDKGNNPKTAVWEFLKTNDHFEIDKSVENKVMVTVAPDGFLKKSKMKLDELTLIIPTYNRHDYLSRVLNYYADEQLTILIADSSKKKYKEQLKSNVKYFYYPEMGIVEKLSTIVNEVKTDFLCFCADDDFWVKDSFGECISFMKKNSDYSSVQGKTILFSQKKRKIEFVPGYVYAADINLTQSCKEDRVYSLMSTYVPLFYSIHKTSHIQDVCKSCKELGITHAVFMELLFSMYTVISGKNKSVELLTYVRDNRSTPTDVDRTSLYDIHHNKMFPKEYENFKQALIEYLDKYNHDKVLSEIQIKKSLDIYLNYIASKKTILPNVNRYKKILKKLQPRMLKNYRKYLKDKSSAKITYHEMIGKSGYPVSDCNAVLAWDNIKNILIKHKNFY